MSWEGYAVTAAFILGVVLVRSEHDHTRQAIAFALMAAAYCAVVFLTWSNDPD
ncbi:MAG: hypothetical protein ACXU82_16485 [Caulobacteraceae bacterium]